MNVKEALTILAAVSRYKITLERYDGNADFADALSTIGEAALGAGEFDIHSACNWTVREYVEDVCLFDLPK